MKITKEILQSFCSTNDMRLPLQKPNLLEGFIYATDGHILIRVPAIQAEGTVENNPDYPNAEKVIQGIIDNCYIEFDFSKKFDCEFEPLYEKVLKKEECEQCDGDGNCTCDECGTQHECGECDGTGEIETYINTDKVIGETTKPGTVFQFKEAYFNPELILRVQKHFPEKGTIVHIGKTEAMKILFGEVLILVMPVNYDPEHKPIIIVDDEEVEVNNIVQVLNVR